MSEHPPGEVHPALASYEQVLRAEREPACQEVAYEVARALAAAAVLAVVEAD